MADETKPPFKKGTLRRKDAATLYREGTVTPGDREAALNRVGPKMRALLQATPKPKP